jgi:hypothetical protein
MPALKKTRYEPFALQLSLGLNPLDAALAAGFAKSQTQASRRAARPEVVARVEELKRRREWGGSRDVGPLIDELADAVREARTLTTAAAFVAVRGLIVEAARLKQMLPAPEDHAPRPPPMTREEWLRKFNPEAWRQAYGPEASAAGDANKPV